MTTINMDSSQAAKMVAEVVLRFRDMWRDDNSHIPPLKETRDFGPILIELWNKAAYYESVLSAESGKPRRIWP